MLFNSTCVLYNSGPAGGSELSAISSQPSADTKGSGMKDFRELKVWEKGHRLALEVYKATEKFPKDELYGLTGQIRRSCVSIPANIPI